MPTATPTPTPTASMQAVVTPSTGAGGARLDTGFGLLAGGLLLMGGLAASRRREAP